MTQSLPKSAISNYRIEQLLKVTCGNWGAQLLISQLRDKYGLMTENEGGCDEGQLVQALQEIFGDSLMSTFRELLYNSHADGEAEVSLP